MRHPHAKAILMLLAMFALSVLLRLGAFSLPVKSHYNATYDRFTNNEIFIHTGFVMNEVYGRYSINEHKFGAYIADGGDEFLPHRYLPLSIYTSFPPTLFAVPWIAFKLLQVAPSVDALSMFNLGLQLASTLILYFLLLAVLPKHRSKDRQLIALLGASIYIFSTGTLHNHLNVYWAHQLLQPFFFGALLIFAKRKGLMKWWESGLVGFSLTIITWTGAVASVGFGLYAILKYWRTRDRAYVWSGLGVGGGMLGALGLIASHVLYVTGAAAKDYLSKVLNRVEARSPGSFLPVQLTVRRFIDDLILDYGAYIAMAYSMFLIYLRKLRWSFAWSVVCLAAFPLIETIPLLAHDTDYGFGRLKWLLPVILVFALLSNEFLNGTRKRAAVLIGTVFLANLAHVALYINIYFGSK